MAQEKLKLHDFEAKTFRRNYGIVVQDIVTAISYDKEQEEIWLQVGKIKKRRVELTAGFSDLKNEYLRRGPSVERIEKKLQPTGRTAWWVRMQDIKDVWFYSQEQK